MKKPLKDARNVNGAVETARFSNITYEDYGLRAIDPSLSENEKIGFPDAFREGHAQTIWRDLLQKLPALQKRGSRVLDIGCGCGHLPQTLIQHAIDNNQHLTMIDHPNMLSQLTNTESVKLAGGQFPSLLSSHIELAESKFDVIICYSVLQVAAEAMNPFFFADSAVELLAPGGQLIFGDIPNFSKLRRFLSSQDGKAFHKIYMNTDSDPHVEPFAMDKRRLDDGFVLGLVSHFRMSGYNAYLLPQPNTLPLNTRREDILLEKP